MLAVRLCPVSASPQARPTSVTSVVLQAIAWAELRVEPQFGFQTIQKALNDPSAMTDSLKGALLQAAAAEVSFLTYALLRNQEKFDAEQARLSSD